MRTSGRFNVTSRHEFHNAVGKGIRSFVVNHQVNVSPVFQSRCRVVRRRYQRIVVKQQIPVPIVCQPVVGMVSVARKDASLRYGVRKRNRPLVLVCGEIGNNPAEVLSAILETVNVRVIGNNSRRYYAHADFVIVNAIIVVKQEVFQFRITGCTSGNVGIGKICLRYFCFSIPVKVVVNGKIPRNGSTRTSIKNQHPVLHVKSYVTCHVLVSTVYPRRTIPPIHGGAGFLMNPDFSGSFI